MSPDDFKHLKRGDGRSGKDLWVDAALPYELTRVHRIETEIAETTANLQKLRKVRRTIVLRASSRSSYQRGVIPTGAQRRKARRERAEA